MNDLWRTHGQIGVARAFRVWIPPGIPHLLQSDQESIILLSYLVQLTLIKGLLLIGNTFIDRWETRECFLLVQPDLIGKVI